MTSPSAHQGYITIAGRALRGRESIPAMSDWEIFLHGFCDTNQNGDSRQIYDCLIDLFPTPEAVLDWPVTDRVTGDPLELPEAGWNGEPGGCANFRSRVGVGGWLRENVKPANWRKIRSLMRCKRRDGSQIPGRQDQAKDFSNGSRLKRDGTRDEPGGLNYQLRAAIEGAGMKGADMHLLWGGCEVPVIDIQLIRYMAPHKLGMEMREYARQKLIVLKAEGYSLELNADRPKAQRTTIAAEDIETDEIPQSNDEAAIRKAQRATAHISAMERQEVSSIQKSQPLYGEWRDFAYEMAEKEDLKANVWHVANWMEFRQSGGDPDRKGRRSQAVIAGDAARLTDTLEFANRTFGPTDFPDAPAEWPLPNVRYPRRERRNRLARLRAEGFSIPAMAVEEGISQSDVVSDLAYYDRILAGRGETPGDYDREKTPPIFHGTIFDFTPEEIGKGTSREGVWLSSNRAAAEKMTRYGASQLAPEGAKEIQSGRAGRILSYRIKPEARIHTIPYWDGSRYEPLVEAMVREGADVLEILRTGDIAARGNDASYYLVQNPSVLEPVSIAESSRGVTGFHEVSLWDAPETPGAYDPALVDRINAGIDRLTSLGMRTEVATGYPTYKLHWSSAGGRWYIFYSVIKKGTQVRLDANQLLVQASRPAIEAAMPLLHMLPLYGQSFEMHWDYEGHLLPPPIEEDDITPSAELGVFYTPEHYDPNIQEYRFYEYGPLDEDDSPYIDAYEHSGTEVSGEGELLDDEVYHHEDFGKAEFLSGETSKSHVIWDIDDVQVEIDYGPWTSRLGEHIDHAAWVSIERIGGAPFDSYMFTPGGPIAKVTDLLDRVHRSNPNLRIVATATRDEERGDIRAKVYERYGWRRISGTDASGSVDMELLHPDQRTPRTPRTPTAFDGIDGYANAIMELV